MKEDLKLLISENQYKIMQTKLQENNYHKYDNIAYDEISDDALRDCRQAYAYYTSIDRAKVLGWTDEELKSYDEMDPITVMAVINEAHDA